MTVHSLCVEHLSFLHQKQPIDPFFSEMFQHKVTGEGLVHAMKLDFNSKLNSMYDLFREQQ